MPNNIEKLTITITSFAYKNGIPEDTTGNGGGFVFDCRILENPGKLELYKSLTGKDKAVADYIESEPQALQFIENIKAILFHAIEKYEKRAFTHLMVNFGCTGGQHRSVYCAEKIAAWLKPMNNINIKLVHTQIQK